MPLGAGARRPGRRAQDRVWIDEGDWHTDNVVDVSSGGLRFWGDSQADSASDERGSVNGLVDSDVPSHSAVSWPPRTWKWNWWMTLLVCWGVTLAAAGELHRGRRRARQPRVDGV